jgi:phage gp46-like protein
MSDLTIIGPDGPDLSVSLNDLTTDDGLRGAVLLSLFCDRRADPGDAIPAGESDRRGWWADEFTGGTDGRIGSRLWLLDGRISIPSLRLAEQYAREALAWMVEEKAARSVSVEATQEGGQLVLSVAIVRPDGRDTRYRYGLLWDSLEATSGI